MSEINLNEQQANETPVSLLAQGYTELDEFRNVSTYTTDATPEIIAKKIEAGEYDGIPSEQLISYGLQRLSEETEKRQEAKREFKRKQEERRQAQSNPFAIEFESDEQ